MAHRRKLQQFEIQRLLHMSYSQHMGTVSSATAAWSRVTRACSQGHPDCSAAHLEGFGAPQMEQRRAVRGMRGMRLGLLGDRRKE